MYNPHPSPPRRRGRKGGEDSFCSPELVSGTIKFFISVC